MGIALLAAILLVFTTVAAAQNASACVNCHAKETPNIVAQWQKGIMAQKGLDCSVCHGSEHKDVTDVAKARLPTPDTCKGCHTKQVEQYRAGKHSLAWAAMNTMPMITHQPSPIVDTEGFKGCSGCHKIGEKSAGELKEFRYGTGSCDSCHILTSAKRAILEHARPVTWVLIIHSGRCGQPPSMAPYGRLKTI